VDNPTYDEAIYMARIKRQRAKGAFDWIIKSNAVFSNSPAPGMDVLLDYFFNMVYALELLLKVLAKDWDVPGKTKFGHKVGKMYEAVFGRPHADAAFMKELEDAILDQKYIYEPATGLIKRVEAMEKLWDELKLQYLNGAWGRFSKVSKEVKADASFGAYLLNNVARFTTPPTHRYDPMTAEQKIAMKRAHIECLQREIARLETEGKPEPTTDICSALHKQFNDEVKRRERMMRMIFEMHGTSELEFMVWESGMAAQDLG
jgi:hypothetical protein